ncbi:MAG: peptidylprolyl isomerase, partial [Anaerolineaceae bacterium]|nr:peptidylprolyl isomerase [Anaerolineaceae bacterium]
LTPTVTFTPSIYNTSTLSPTQLALFPPTSTDGPTNTPGATETPLVSSTAEITETPTPAASPTITLTPTITPTATPYTMELYTKDVGQYITSAKEIQLSKEQLRTFIAKGLLRTRVYEALTKDVKPVAEQVWARHILVASEEEAKAALDRINAGETFAAVASTVSTDTSNKDQGGDLGWFARGAMVAEFENAAFALKVGEISQPVKTDFGYHIIQVLGHEERPLTEQQISQSKQKIYQDWLTQAKKDTKIETYDRWMEILPTDPAVPADIQQVLEQLQQSSQPQ